MPAWLKGPRGYLLAAAGGAAVTGIVLLVVAFPKLWPIVVSIVSGVATAAFFPQKKKKEGADAPKGKAEILAGDPRDSLDRLPADARARLDASTKSDVDAQVDAIFKRHGRNGGTDPGATGR